MAIIDDLKKQYRALLSKGKKYGALLAERRGASVLTLASLRNQLLTTSSIRRSARSVYHRYFRRERYPATVTEMRASPLYNAWWYYGVELLPGMCTPGIYPDDHPMLPRILMRKCNVGNMDCLDLGSMEGLMPVLMRRQGASRVLATDATFHCFAKMAAIKHYYRVNFDFRAVGLMYDLSRKLKGEGGFDLINLSGLLYHVFSPMHVLAGVRPLLKKGGLMIVSTNVVNRDDHSMEFNYRGRLQTEQNTFWYPSVPLLDYLLRYFQLLPIDCLFLPRTPRDPTRYVHGVKAGYISVACRATDDFALAPEDNWGAGSIDKSWEWNGLCDREMMSSQPKSNIEYTHELAPSLMHSDRRSIDLFKAVNQIEPILRASSPQDSTHLTLGDQF